MQMRDDLGKEASDCMNDYAMWSPQAYRELIRRLAERNRTLEAKARAWDNWQANTKEVA